MYARVQFVVAQRAGALTVPRNAIVDVEGTRGVFVADGKTARFKPITSGIVDGEAVEITEGLADGEHGDHARVRVAQGRRSDRDCRPGRAGRPWRRSGGARAARQGRRRRARRRRVAPA